MRWGQITLRILAVLALCMTAACGTRSDGPLPGTPGEVARLEAAILALGPDVDAGEAARAARISYAHTHDLARQYGITDPPLVHNTKVNMGLRPRGLCWHWAEDMERRLAAEKFRTLDLHRAIASADNPFRIDHSTALISRAGAPIEQAIVLDPWRKGGVLTWVPFAEDGDYDWVARRDVLDKKLRRLRINGDLPEGAVPAF